MNFKQILGASMVAGPIVGICLAVGPPIIILIAPLGIVAWVAVGLCLLFGDEDI